ncbi:hypothetical protein JVX90_00600 [Gordonia sp. PDNC005]|uniref:hypothetical protein n=1 Tax=unclassified Gordonia (in: high G+C Gram-positive bacteria) TaxID=2657482 RepID=UPI0019623E76|nr:hypothetical protein [Gordonia sp. PDNC005]QRY62809.1 hypothetical protein JVX90_00600 [Gordonia sp. PDNC005]
MSDPQDQTPDTPTAELDATAAPTEPSPHPEPAVSPTPPAASKEPVVVPVQRRFLIAGSVVGAIAVVGLSFGAGFLVGDHSGNDSDRRHGRIEVMRFEDRSDQQGQFPGLQQFPGQGEVPNFRMRPQEGSPDESTAPATPSTPTPSA